MIIYKSDGTERTTFDSYTYSGTHMGERKVVVTIESAQPIDFQIGDYIWLKEQDFFLQTMPVVNRNYQTLMLGYTLTFWWTGYELGLTKFLDVVENEPDKVYYSNNNNVVFTGTIKNLLDRIIANLNRTHPVTSIFDDSWHYFIGETVDQTIIKDIVADDLYCLDVLQFSNSAFGLDFLITPTRRILVGFTASELNAAAPLFEYGKDKGLCDINRLQNDQKVITRVYAYGSERNINPDYRRGVSGHEYHPRLILPEIGAIEGTDLVCTGGYLADTAMESIHGIREDSYINENIYPTVTLLDNTIHKVDTIYDRPAEGDDPIYKEVIKPAWIERTKDSEFPYIFHEGSVSQTVVSETEFNTVVVYIDVPFDINSESIKSPVNAKMSFKTGYLQGVELDIISWEKEMNLVSGVPTATGLWKVRLKRDVNGENYALPNSTIPIAIGDEFVLLDIYLPAAYEAAAEQALLDDAISWLQSRRKSPDGYSVKVPEEYIARNPANEAALVEGFPIQLKDTVIGADQQAVTIQSLSITCKDGGLPSCDLTISPTPIKGYISKIGDQLKSANNKVATIKAATDNEISSIIKSATIIKDAVLNSSLQIRGSQIEPNSIQSSALSPDVRSREYTLDAFFAVNYNGNPNSAYGSSGIMVHKDVDITWGDTYDLAHQTWTISAPQTFTLDPDKAYFVYIKGSLIGGSAIWVISETKIGMIDVAGYFMFEWGSILGIREGVRYSQNQYGVNQVSAYVYIAYASAIDGTGFTLTNDPALRFMAIKSSPTEIETPVVGDFVGLWFERSPDLSDISHAELNTASLAWGDSGHAGIPNKTAAFGSGGEAIYIDQNDHIHEIADVTGLQAALDNKLETSLKGSVNGLAELDENGFVRNTQLPSYVDDVIERADFASLPIIGESGKIYITTNDNKTYRWSGSTYAVISDTLALGETYTTAYRGDRGKIAYDYSQIGHVQVSPASAQLGSIWMNGSIQGSEFKIGGRSILQYDGSSIYLNAADRVYLNAGNTAFTLSDGNLSTLGYYIGNDKLNLNAHKNGSLGANGTIYVSSGASLTPTWKTLNAAGIAPSIGSVNYVQNQNDLLQNASQYIDGSVVVGRSYSDLGKSAVFFGDSVTYLQKFSTPVCKSLGLTEVNLGLSGSTIHDFYSRYSEIPTYSASYKYIFFDYGINDAFAAYSLADYNSSLSSAIDQCVIKGWPLNSIIIITPNYITDLTKNLVSYAHEAVVVAKSKGVKYTNTYWYMLENGGSSLLYDDIHPTELGGLIMAKSILSNLYGGGEFAESLIIGKSIDVGLNVYSANYFKNNVELFLNPFKKGSIGVAGTIPVSNGATSEFNWKTVNETVGGNSLSTDFMPKFNGYNFINSKFQENGNGTTYVYDSGIETNSIFLFNAIYAAGIRSNREAVELLINLNQVGFRVSPTGVVSIPGLSGSGTRLIGVSNAGDLSALANSNGYLSNDGSGNMSFGAITGFLPLAGGTLTGGLIGTTANLSGAATAASFVFGTTGWSIEVVADKFTIKRNGVALKTLDASGNNKVLGDSYRGGL